MPAKQEWDTVKCAPGDTSGLCANHQPALLAVTSVLLALSTIIVGLRLISRGLCAMNFWFDDAAIIVGLVGFCVHGQRPLKKVTKFGSPPDRFIRRCHMHIHP